MSLLDLPFPPLCIGCERVLATPPTQLPLCARCRAGVAPLPEGERRLDGIAALFPYEGGLVSAVGRLKYGRHLALAGPLGRLLALAPELQRSAGFELVLPIPQHPLRSLWRGHDPVRAVARRALWEVDGHAARLGRALRRCAWRPPQVDLQAAARRASPPGSFSIRVEAQVAGRRVLVVDDVTTTGSTLRAAMEQVSRAGAEQVAGLALLRACA